MKKEKIFVLGLGGSVIFPENLNISFLKRFSSFIEREIKRGKKFIIVTGGGRLARQYQKALGKIGKFNSKDKDLLGIWATRLNGYLLKTIFKNYSYPAIFDKRFKIKNFKNHSVIIASGWEEGYSTDFVALQIALDFDLKKAIFLGKVNYVYTKNPDEYKDAKPIKKITWEDYLKLIPQKWKPGLRVPVDPAAARFAELHNLEVVIAGVKDFSNLEKILGGEKFKGTIITNSQYPIHGMIEALKLKKKNFKEVEKRIIEVIKEGKVIIFPTDTVYGLLGSAKNKKAVDNIFRIKKRPKNKPLPIFVKDLKTAKKFAEINKTQEKFLKKIWPGRVTVVLKRKKAKIYGVSKKSIALRIPKYKLLNEILKRTNLPLIGTSANVSGYLPSGKIQEVLKQFKNKGLIIIDAGNLKKSKPSTIIDLRQRKIKIIRQGDIKLKNLKN